MSEYIRDPLPEPDPVISEETSVEEEVVAPSTEEVVAPSTEEVVQNVQEILTSDLSATKTTEEKLNQLIELLKSGYHVKEYLDDNDEIKEIEGYDMLSVSKKLHNI